MTNPTPPRRFRFGLRTLFAVVTVVSMWVAYHVNWIRQRHEAAAGDDVRVLYDDSTNPFRDDKTPPNTTRAPWSLRLLGERGVLIIGVSSRRDVERIHQLFPEAKVNIR